MLLSLWILLFNFTRKLTKTKSLLFCVNPNHKMKLFLLILLLIFTFVYGNVTTNEIIIEDVPIDNSDYVSHWKNASLGYWFRNKFIYY